MSFKCPAKFCKFSGTKTGLTHHLRSCTRLKAPGSKNLHSFQERTAEKRAQKRKEIEAQGLLGDDHHNPGPSSAVTGPIPEVPEHPEEPYRDPTPPQPPSPSPPITDWRDQPGPRRSTRRQRIPQPVVDVLPPPTSLVTLSGVQNNPLSQAPSPSAPESSQTTEGLCSPTPEPQFYETEPDEFGLYRHCRFSPYDKVIPMPADFDLASLLRNSCLQEDRQNKPSNLFRKQGVLNVKSGGQERADASWIDDVHMEGDTVEWDSEGSRKASSNGKRKIDLETGASPLPKGSSISKRRRVGSAPNAARQSLRAAPSQPFNPPAISPRAKYNTRCRRQREKKLREDWDAAVLDVPLGESGLSGLPATSTGYEALSQEATKAERLELDALLAKGYRLQKWNGRDTLAFADEDAQRGNGNALPHNFNLTTRRGELVRQLLEDPKTSSDLQTLPIDLSNSTPLEPINTTKKIA
ncbi:hypothetical protein CC1G_13489 [Coprinopsis cinerea okayama7|uniref:Uncharacterized protein n=1 Tax=Coprinopsis cinerea (strain Okayama-7 / 130 / ATCC MYA-4618 / FGSC 9003) TaxID=240176 RepID=A8PJ05_COPC7|nr:hypothetical protein CC1G_13489 [Coprinopsis cinerea okayama7\|eukprot:XP_001841646.2 hypothetical protein CC1G_13489 [Coprinopsis cinerea okayama7\